MREEKSKWRVMDSGADFPNSRLAMDKTPTRIALRERPHSSAPALAGEDDDLTTPMLAAKNGATWPDREKT
jgi:hypothetical protein